MRDTVAMLLQEDVEHVRSRIPPEPCRILEVGCGGGALASELSAAGHDVVAVDPIAPEGAIFRRSRIEDFATDGEFDAVVAMRSLHHVDRLDVAVERIAAALRPGGVLIIREFDRKRLDEPTLRWFHRQLQAVGATGSKQPPRYREWRRRLKRELRGHVIPFAEVRAAIRDGGFAESELVEGPYLYRYGLEPEVVALERALVERGAINATGVDVTAQRP